MNLYLRIWNFIDENKEIDSLIDISRGLRISYPVVCDNVRMLEDIGYITVTVEKGKKKVYKTQKWSDTRVNMLDLYKYNVSLDEKKRKDKLKRLNK